MIFSRLRSAVAFLLFLTAGGALLSGCTLPWQQEMAGLSVLAEDQQNFQVYLDDLHLGQTPIQKTDLAPGTYKIKLDPGNGTALYEGSIRLFNGTVTAVNWSFSSSQTTGTGEIMELEPLGSKSRAEVSVITIPEGATVQLNNTTYGLSPVILDEAEPGQYTLSMTAVGHVKKTLTVQVENGYKLHVFSRLSKTTTELAPAPTPTETSTESSTLANDPSTLPESPSSTGSAQTPPGMNALTPPYLTIKDTGTGWLRVRATASSVGTEVTRVDVGEKFSVKNVQAGWYEIEYEPGKTGWVSGQFVEYVAQ